MLQYINRCRVMVILAICFLACVELGSVSLPEKSFQVSREEGLKGMDIALSQADDRQEENEKILAESLNNLERNSVIILQNFKSLFSEFQNKLDNIFSATQKKMKLIYVQPKESYLPCSKDPLEVKVEQQLKELGKALSYDKNKQENVEKFKETIEQQFSKFESIVENVFENTEKNLKGKLEQQLNELVKTISQDMNNQKKFIRETTQSFEQRISKFESEIEKLSVNTEKTKKAMFSLGSCNDPSLIIIKQTVATKTYIDDQLIYEYNWFVPNIDEEIKNATNNGNYTLESKHFYLGLLGYRMRIILRPNKRLTEYIGLFVGLVPGEYDDAITWPYHYDSELAIVSHKSNVADETITFKMPFTGCKESFMRAGPLSLSGCGSLNFISHKNLNANEDAFKVNGNILVRFRVFVK